MGATMRRTIGTELRGARLQAGLSLAAVGSIASISTSELSRAERGLSPWLTVEAMCRVAAVVGLVPAIRLYPDGSPLRDAAHAALLGRLRQELFRGLRWRTEVPLPLPGDRRAWDAVVRGPDWWVAVEAETRLHDLQALQRRIALKRRDSGEPAVVLLVNDTRSNRATLDEVRESLRAEFPLDARDVLGALRAGIAPSGGGIVRM